MRSNTNPSTCQPNTPPQSEAGCCCDAALSRAHYRSACCQVNHHELMQRHQCHIRCECTGTMHTQCTSVWQELIGLPIARCSHRRGAAQNTHSGTSIPLNPCSGDCQQSAHGRYTIYALTHCDDSHIDLHSQSEIHAGKITPRVEKRVEPHRSTRLMMARAVTTPLGKDKSVSRHHGVSSQYNGI